MDDACLPTSETNANQDKDLDLIVGDWISYVCGMPRDLVRRRWQEIPAKQPPRHVDWCAISVTDEAPDQYSAQMFDGTGDGLITSHQHITLSVLASFYGDHASKNARALWQGSQIDFNRAPLTQNGMAILDFGRLTRVPALVNQGWLPRTDVTFRLRQHEQRNYAVHSVLTTQGEIVTDEITQPFDTENSG